MPPVGRVARLVIVQPFQRFLQLEASGSIVLLAAAIAALAWANSPFASSYEALWATKFTIGVGGFALSKPLILWVNDGLMAVFFFLVGLEIKREFLFGSLANPRAAAFPIVGALGGMLVPAAVYLAFNFGGPGERGWGIPMATDIAFALGAFAILARRLPAALRVFLAAAAIVDDLGAVLVIALFYTPDVAVAHLAGAAVLLAVLLAMNRGGVRGPLPYAILGLLLWLAVLKSGVHATVAGVLLALTIPAGPRVGATEFVAQVRDALARFPATERLERGDAAVRKAAEVDRDGALAAIEDATEAMQSPLARIEHDLAPWVSYAIIPIFAFANAGVRVDGSLAAALANPITLGIVAGLVLGKQVGMTLFPWLAVRFGIAALPAGATWRHVYGVAWLAGIGFTMSLFIATLGLPASLVPEAKLGILAASVVAGAGGLIVLATAPAARAPAVEAA